MAGNKNSGDRKAPGKRAKHGPELAQRIRALILTAFDKVDQEGVLMSDILVGALKENPLKFLDVASKFCPKDIELIAEVRKTVINAQPEMDVAEWQKQHQTLSGDPSPDPKPH